MEETPTSSLPRPKRFLERLLVEADEPSDGPLAFRRYASRTTVRLVQGLAFLGCGLSVLFWPMDFLVFASDSHRLHVAFAWRTIIALSTLLIGLLGPSLRKGGGASTIVLTTFFFGLVSVTFLTASRMGGPTTPWFYTVFAVPLFTTMMLVPLHERLLLVYGGIVTALGTYFAAEPRYLADPHLTAFLGVLAGVSVLFVGVGHMLYAVIRTTFEQRQELRRLSRTDPLTGLANHAHLRSIATHEIARARRSGEGVALLMIDVDHFKSINDAFGHAVGDAVLKELARLFVSTVREVDAVGRVGGEEFAIVLPSTKLATAVEVAERLRQAVEGTASFARHAPARCTVSIGCAQLGPSDDDLDGLLKRADQALYDAKQGGRNRVESR